MISLRPYQARDADALRGVYRAGFSAPLYVLPTGGGKTVVFCYITHSAIARGNVVYILVHRQELLWQASRSLDSLGVKHGLISPGHTETDDLVQVASVQTLARRLKKGAHRYRPDLIIIDEGHHAVAGTWSRILEAFENAKVLGVTATACRTDTKGLGKHAGGVFDELVEGPSIAQLIEDGYLCAPQVFAPLADIDLEGMRTRGGDWDRKQVASAVDRPVITGDAVKHYSKLCPGQPAIAFCASVKHAEHVALEFQAAGYKAASLDGGMPDKRRRELIKDLGRGRLQVLTSCDIVSEGTDIPVVAAAILLRPTQSEGLFLQQVGRVLRPVYKEGADLSTRAGRLAAIRDSVKPRAIVLDHVGNCLRHGLPDSDREWTLDGKSTQQKKKEQKQQEVQIRQCETCFAVHKPAPRCPVCGHVYKEKTRQPEQRDGELQEMTPEHANYMKRRRRFEESQCRTLEDFMELAKRRGYKPGWARIRYAKRQKNRGAA